MRSLLLLAVLCLGLCAHATSDQSSPTLGDSDEMNRIRLLLFRNVTKDLPKPQLCFLLGGVGAGKSSALRNTLASLGLIPAQDRVHLGFTRVMVNLDGWDASNRCSSPRLHRHAKEVQEIFFEEAVRSRTNVLFEGSIIDPDLALSMADFALARNYVVNVVGASLDARTAASRAVQQMRVNSHWVSLHDLLRSHIGTARVFPALIQPEQINCTLLFDTMVPRKPALVLRDNAILLPQKFADFMSQATLSEEQVRAALSQTESDAFHTLCDCAEVSDTDETVCGTKHDKEKSHEKSRKRWRATAVAFIVFAGLLLLALIVLALLYNQMRGQGYDGRAYRYDAQPPRRSPPVPIGVDTGYAKLENP